MERKLKNVKIIFSPFFDWVICVCVCVLLIFTSCLYTLEINPLSVASFASIFSHSDGFLFIWFVVSFAVHNGLYEKIILNRWIYVYV